MCLAKFTVQHNIIKPDAPGGFTNEAWEMILSLIPHFTTLETFEVVCTDVGYSSVRCDFGSDSFADPYEEPSDYSAADDLAVALAKNSSLKAIDFSSKYKKGEGVYCGEYEVVNFVCRLYSRRNRIKQMMQQGQMFPQLWPLVLESMIPDPSAVFLASKLIPLPMSSGKRKWVSKETK